VDEKGSTPRAAQRRALRQPQHGRERETLREHDRPQRTVAVEEGEPERVEGRALSVRRVRRPGDETIRDVAAGPKILDGIREEERPAVPPRDGAEDAGGSGDRRARP
jgi:hypothetical protein